ncbi:MAG: D-arabinono-1,4-lactone oxidase [Polyangiales bacterium]
MTTQLERRGWALPDLGGVTHQTVAGFLMTGSAGGSTRHSIYDAIVCVRMMDGTGATHRWTRDDPRFFAVASSMGLLGILVDVTFACEPRYDVIGEERITSRSGAAFQWDPAGSHDASPRPSVAEFLRATEYARFMWWPQRNVDRVVSWTAGRASPRDLPEHRAPSGKLTPKPYSALGDGLQNPALTPVVNYASQLVAGAFYDSMAQSRRHRDTLLRALPPSSVVLSKLRDTFEEHVFPAVLDVFLPENTNSHQRFWGPWHHVLPMDNQMVDAFLPTDFTELWFDIDQADEVMCALQTHFHRGGLSATGTFLFEFYACSSSDFWMHPSYARDSFRVDVFWFKRNRGEAATFFEQFWQLLAPFGYRVHWGKHFPSWSSDPMRGCLASYPRVRDFLALRAACDPDGTFLNPHWSGLVAYGES